MTGLNQERTKEAIIHAQKGICDMKAFRVQRFFDIREFKH